MPNFGYMTDRLRLEEMRVLAQQPGGQRAFVAAWKRWIYQHRSVGGTAALDESFRPLCRQDFIRDPASATASFLQDYAEAARVAGKDVLRAWLLVRGFLFFSRISASSSSSARLRSLSGQFYNGCIRLSSTRGI